MRWAPVRVTARKGPDRHAKDLPPACIALHSLGFPLSKPTGCLQGPACTDDAQCNRSTAEETLRSAAPTLQGHASQTDQEFGLHHQASSLPCLPCPGIAAGSLHFALYSLRAVQSCTQGRARGVSKGEA